MVEGSPGCELYDITFYIINGKSVILKSCTKELLDLTLKWYNEDSNEAFVCNIPGTYNSFYLKSKHITHIYAEKIN